MLSCHMLPMGATDLLANLEAALEIEKTDKQARNPGHAYVYAYAALLGPKARSIRNVLEIGIGSTSGGKQRSYANNMRFWYFTSPGRMYKPGASLRAWARFFPNATIWGVDIDPFAVQRFQREFAVPRVNVRVLNSTEVGAVERLDLPRTFDFVLDDGDHSWAAQQQTLLKMWPRVADGGHYFIEDVLWSSVRPNIHNASVTLPAVQELMDRTGAFVIEADAFDPVRMPGSYIIVLTKSSYQHESRAEDALALQARAGQRPVRHSSRGGSTLGRGANFPRARSARAAARVVAQKTPAAQ
jgi:hypothetical protein